ncbi:MAG: serine/threonine protein kinase [Anaerolineae bacterium]|nr:serine/threonine protein kinase [Anaerolineae bacterium]
MNVLDVGMLLADKYRIVSSIAQGGFGRVYLGYDEDMERYVAIKELLHDTAAESYDKWEDYRMRFIKEARTVGQFAHPNVVRAYSLETTADSSMYLVMEYVDGESLEELLEEGGPLRVERALDVAIDICTAISAIYRRDIVHRDIKPSNILVSRQGAAKLTDFGIAQVGHETRRTQQAIGHPGTPAYKSPEQATSTAYLDQRSDLYALGLVIYEMLTGRLYARDRIPPSHYAEQVPPSLDATVMRALDENPAGRYQTAEELLVDLRRIHNEDTLGQMLIVLRGLVSDRLLLITSALLFLALALTVYRLSAVVLAPSPPPEIAAMQAEITATPSPTPAPPSATPGPPTATTTPELDLRASDAHEPDDETPITISVGEIQRRSFFPEGDIDRVAFRVKAGLEYVILTANLNVGVDTLISVAVNGVQLANDDISAGSLASQVSFLAAQDGIALATIQNQDRYGPERTYDLSVFITVPTASPTQPVPPSPAAAPPATAEPTLTPRPALTSEPTWTPMPTSAETLSAAWPDSLPDSGAP